MKNRLLLTTALVGVAFAMPAMAEDGFLASAGQKLEGTYSGYTNSDGTRAGVVTVAEKTEGVTVADGTVFKGNSTSASAGGAMKLLDSVAIGENVRFEGNKAQDGGWGAGAIYLRDRTGGTTTIGANAEFIGNESGLGGALGIEAGSLTLADGALFEGNKAVNGKGGAVAVWTDKDNNLKEGSTIDLGSAIFRENEAKFGGAIANANNDASDKVTEYGHTVSVGENSLFENNSASESGGAIYNMETVNVADGTKFIKNSANQYGGAIYNNGTATIGDNVVFDGNHTDTSNKDDGNDTTSGAIHNSEYSEMTIGTNAQFTNNSAEYAGAILNQRSDLTIGTGALFQGNESTNASGGAIVNNAYGSISIGEDSRFIGNISAKSGGAIMNDGHENNGSDKQASLTIGSGAEFSGNQAKVNGGAIANYGNGENDSFLSLSNATFTNNSAGASGGAIYNDANNTIKLSGDMTFSGNTAEGALNDIHNEGTVTVSKDASLTLDGGISGDGSLKLEVNTTLNVKQGVTEIANEVSSEGTTVNVTLKGGESSIDLNQIFTNKANEDSLDNIKLGENSLFDFVQDGEDPSVWNANQKSADEVAAALGATGSEAAAVLALVSGGADTGNEAFDSVAEALNDAAQNGNGAAAKEAAKLGADANPIVRTVETDLHNMVFAAVTDELNGASGAMAEGKSSGDAFKQVKAWIRGMFNHADKEATSKASGFDANIYGVAMGIDKQIDHAVKVGAGYAYSQTDVSAHGRDTDVDTHTAFVYGRYQPADWYVNTVVAYNWSDYDEKKSVLGSNANAKYDVESLGVQSMFGYETKLGGYDVTPEAGLRYVHISQDAYHDRLGNRTGSNDSDILTAVIGTKVAKNYALDSETVIRPELKAAVTYDLIDDGNNANVVLANGAAYRVNGEKLDRLGFELGAKVATDVTDNLEISAGWEGRFRKDYNDQTAMLNAKYKF